MYKHIMNILLIEAVLILVAVIVSMPLGRGDDPGFYEWRGMFLAGFLLYVVIALLERVFKK